MPPQVGQKITREYVDAKLGNFAQRLNDIMIECADINSFFARESDADLKSLPSTSNPPDQYTQDDVNVIRAAAVHMQLVCSTYNGPGKANLDKVRGIGL